MRCSQQIIRASNSFSCTLSVSAFERHSLVCYWLMHRTAPQATERESVTRNACPRRIATSPTWLSQLDRKILVIFADNGWRLPGGPQWFSQQQIQLSVKACFAKGDRFNFTCNAAARSNLRYFNSQKIGYEQVSIHVLRPLNT